MTNQEKQVFSNCSFQIILMILDYGVNKDVQVLYIRTVLSVQPLITNKNSIDILECLLYRI